MQGEEPLMVLTKTLARLVREYHVIAKRIVERADRQRYLLAADRNRLDSLNGQVDTILLLMAVEEGRREALKQPVEPGE